MLCISLFLVLHGLRLLKQIGQPDSRRDDAPMLELEKTTRLVKSGAYRYIRHPLYSSLLFLAWGVFFKAPALWPGFLLALTASVFLFATARCEERENLHFFGEAYQIYMHETKRFIPFIL